MALLQYLNRNDKPKVALPSKLIHDQSASFNKRTTSYIRNAVGAEVTKSGIGKKQCRQYKYSAKERVDIGKYFTEVLWLPYLRTTPLRQNVHIKITPSCKFKCI